MLQAQRDQNVANACGYALEGSRCSFSSEETNPNTIVTNISPSQRSMVICESPIISQCPASPLEAYDTSRKLDDKAEDYLRFGRQVLEPAFHSTGHRGWVALDSPRDDFMGPDLLTGCCPMDVDPHTYRADCYQVFIYAILAYCASGFAAVNQAQHAQHDALNYSTSCMKNLREYLQKLNYNINDISEDLVYRLFRAEVLAKNHPSAAAHGKLLRKIFEHRAQSGCLRLDILSNTLYQDNHRAFASWSRPIFDQDWVQEKYQHDWQQASALFDDAQEDETKLSSCIKNQLLRSYLLAAKKLLLQTQTLTRRKQSATSVNFFWFVAQCEWLQMCLMNYYLDRDQRNTAMDAKSNTKTSASLELSVCLATLYVLRHSKNDVRIQGQPLFKGCNNIYLHMDARIGTLARTISRRESEQNPDAIIFILFVTAIAEHYNASFATGSDEAFAWRRRLGQYLAANDVTSWDALSRILSRFPYTEQELPAPTATWFEELVIETRSG